MAIKVLIIDDSALVRQTMTEVLESDHEIKVIATASDPIIGVRKIQQERPDVIVLDIEMARMDGLTFLRKLNSTIDPIPCVVCSSTIVDGSPNAIKALELGACEVIAKPALGTKKFREEAKVRICDAVKSANKCQGRIKKIVPSAWTSSDDSSVIQPKNTADVIMEKPTRPLYNTVTEKVVVVGASTGGTEALKDFLEMFPAKCPPIVIVQHMPEHFTAAFAKRLDSLCQITIKEAQDGDKVLQGQALIAPGNFHTLLKYNHTGYHVEVRDGPLVSRHRPSVDVLFRSAARYAGKNAIGVIMTGMGDDGAKGMKEMHDNGAFTIAQDEASCIVFGMPCEAIKTGGVDKVVSLKNLAGEVMKAAGFAK